MTKEQLEYHAKWHTASGHPSGKIRVVRELFDGRGLQELNGKTGKLVLFKTFEAAQRRADTMNT